MAFPYLSEENFEDASGSKLITGTTDLAAATHFDSATDADGIMTIQHFSELAKTPGVAMPHTGAYALRVDLNGGTNSATMNETGAWDLSADDTFHARMLVWFGGSNVAMANNDAFDIFGLNSSGSTAEVRVFINYTTAAGYKVHANETTSTSGSISSDLSLNEWHTIEVHCEIDSGVGNDGSIQLYVDGQSVGTVSSLNQGAITDGFVGANGPDAGTSGTLLIDSVIADDERIYPPADRWVEEVSITKSAHVLLGPGTVKNATLLAGDGSSTTQALEVFDSNTGDDTDVTNRRLRLISTSSSGQVIDPAGVPLHLKRGAYVKLTGTADAEGPRAIVQICPDTAYGSEGSIRQHGLRP